MSDTMKYDQSELEQRRETTNTRHIDDVESSVRDALRADLAAEIRDSFRVAGAGGVDVDEIYVTGSWASGEALSGISDLDVFVVVDAGDDAFHKRQTVEEAVRTIVGSTLTEGTPFDYVDPRCVRETDDVETEVVL